MGFDTGTGGSVGGLPTKTPNELEASAWAAVASQQIGKMPNSDDVLFSQINPQTTWKYNSTSSNPVLHPLTTLRMASSAPREPDQTWSGLYAKLLDYLPSDVRERLQQENQIPLEERSPEYSAFNRVLEKTAKAMAWLQGINEPMDPAAIALSHIPQNNALAATAFEGTVSHGKEVLSAAQDFINQIGPNAINHDKLLGIANQFQNVLQDLDDLGHPIGSNKQSLSLLAEDLQTLSSQLHGVSFGNDMQVLRTTVDVMALVTAALASKSAAPSLLLGLSIASTGLSETQSTGGVLSPAFTNAIGMLANGLLSTALPHADAGSRRLFPLLVGTMLIGGSTLASIAASDKEQRSLPLDLAMRLATGSGIFTEVSQGVASASGASENTKKTTGNALALTTALMMIHTASVHDKSAATSLTESLSPWLSRMLDDVEPFVGHVVREGEAQSDAAHAVGVVLKQGRIALNEDNPAAFVQTISDAFSSIVAEGNETSSKKLIEGLQKFAEVIGNNIVSSTEADSSVKTGIVQI